MNTITYNQTPFLKISMFFFTLSLILVIPMTLIFDETFATIISFFIIFLVIQALPNDYNKFAVFISSFYFVVLKIYNYLYLPSVSGPDSQKYFAQTVIFNDFNTYLNFAISEIKIAGIFDVSSYTFFGLFYMPIYTFFEINSTQAIGLLNSIFVISTFFLWLNLVNNHMTFIEGTRKKLLLNTLVILLFVSPSFIHWSSSFLKDSFAVFLSVLSFSFFFNKRYLWFTVVIIIAIAIRPYAIVFILCYWLIFKNKNKLGLIGVALAALIVLIEANVLALINVIPMTVRLFVIPNPFSIKNWEYFFFPTLESVIIGLFSILAVINYFSNPSSRKFYHSFLIAAVGFSCTLTLLGYTGLMSKEMSYGFLSAGDDMFRKKLPFMLVTYTMIAYTIATLKTRIKIK